MKRDKKPQINSPVSEYISLYQSGLSIYKIAEKLGKKPNTILVALRYWNIKMRNNLGKQIEDRVKVMLLGMGKEVVVMPGDKPYDLLVDGSRVDVKCSHLSGKNNPKYFFEINHKKNILKSYKRFIDQFYLVFLDDPGSPVYSIDSSELKVKKSFSVGSNLKTKLPIVFINYLSDRR